MSNGVRFAPSPTGRFHVGNLRTAWISHAWARALREPWVVRFEDIDQERVRPEYRERQLADLAALGLRPDKVYHQSERYERHWMLFVAAVRVGAVYPCDCSREEVRRDVAGIASAPHAPAPPYSGACRAKDPRRALRAKSPTVGWRFRMPADSGAGSDKLNLVEGRRDFLVARSAPALDAHGLPVPPSFVPAYHWACGIDDRDGDYTLLVRAWDLESATEPQRAIGAWVEAASRAPASGAGGWVPPAVFHTSLLTRDDGGRLEKRTAGVTLAELVARGCSAEALAIRFAASFEPERRTFAPGRRWGEAAHSRSLASLSITGGC